MMTSTIYYHEEFNEIVINQQGKCGGTTEARTHKMALHWIGDYPQRQWTRIGSFEEEEIK